MKRQVVAIIVLLTLVMSMGDFAKADIVDNDGEVLSEAPYIQSPTNTTYSYDSLTLNVTFYAEWYEKNVDFLHFWGYSMNYSLDGKANQTLTLDLYAFGSNSSYIGAYVPLLNLSEGTHHLTAYLMAASTETYYDSQTVVFTIATNSPTQTPTSTPAVPELTLLVIMPLLLSIFSVAVIVSHRKNR